MEPTGIYSKTAKGLEEVQQRRHKLAARLRRILIMVDGRSTTAETVARLASLGDIAAALHELDEGGFIAVREASAAPGPAAAPQADAPPSAPVVGPDGSFNLDKAKGFARYVVLGTLGPVGARRVERIDAVRSSEELRIELDALHDLLPQLVGKRQAEQVWKQLEPLMLSIIEGRGAGLVPSYHLLPP